MEISRGVVYVATGGQYIDEALVSIKSLNEQMPNIPVTLFASEQVECPSYVDLVVMDQPNFDYPGIDKIKYISSSPYQETIFLDSDTFVVEPFSGISQLLKEFDLALSHAPVRLVPRRVLGNAWIDYEDKSISRAFSELNTGVILFRKSDAVMNLFKDWLVECVKRIKNRGKPLHDQASFRISAYRSPVRIATLTPEYNCRFIFPTYVYGKVKILHGRAPNLRSIAASLNESEQPRVFLLEGKGIHYIDHDLLLDYSDSKINCERLQDQVSSLEKYIRNSQDSVLHEKMLRERIKKIQRRNLKLKSKLEDRKKALNIANSEIKSMKSGQLWRMRTLLAKVKKGLGLSEK